MRPIEFRGLDCKSGNWVYGDIIHGVGLKDGYIYLLPKVKNLATIPNCDPLDGVRVNPETVGQFTGLFDKHGTKIFEGDIIASHGYTHIIEYEEQQARFVATRFEFSIVSKDSCSFTKLWIDECDKVVVGNIHERKDVNMIIYVYRKYGKVHWTRQSSDPFEEAIAIKERYNSDEENNRLGDYLDVLEVPKELEEVFNFLINRTTKNEVLEHLQHILQKAQSPISELDQFIRSLENEIQQS